AGYSVAAGAEAAGAEAEAAGAAALDEALGQWAGVENLELRLVPGGIDARVLAYLRALPEQGRLQRP
ncbi:MAG: putative peptidoglycan binding domain-containing protein, partial [Candidatus Lutibacillus vidarii]